MKEKELQSRIAGFLSRWFDVEMEVGSTDTKKRIDLVIVHKSDTMRQYPIGIEIKLNDKKTGSDAGQWLKQAAGYCQKEFMGYGKCMIIVAPQFSGFVLEEGDLMDKHPMSDWRISHQHNVNTFLGQFNIGELQKYIRSGDNKMFRIVYNGSIIWDNYDDRFRISNYTRLCNR